MENMLKRVDKYIKTSDFTTLKYIILLLDAQLQETIVRYLTTRAATSNNIDLMKFLVDDINIVINNDLLQLSIQENTKSDVASYLLEFKEIDVSDNNNITLKTAINYNKQELYDKIVEHKSFTTTEDIILYAITKQQDMLSVMLIEDYITISSYRYMFATVIRTSLSNVISSEVFSTNNFKTST